MIKHVVWDWNGTLVNDVDLCVRILNGILRNHGKKTITVSEYRSQFFFPAAKFYETLGLPSCSQRYDLIADYFIREYRKHFKECKLQVGALGVLKKLQSITINQSILSAGKDSDLNDFTANYGINKFMKKIDGACNVNACGKEDRAFAHISNLGLNNEEVLFVGDTFHDWEVAQLTECRVLLFNGGHDDLDRLKNTSAPIINSLSEVLGWVRN